MGRVIRAPLLERHRRKHKQSRATYTCQVKIGDVGHHKYEALPLSGVKHGDALLGGGAGTNVSFYKKATAMMSALPAASMI